MNRRKQLIRLWEHLALPEDIIEACSVEYDLLCPHCRIAGRGDVHLVLLPDDSGFRCSGSGHSYFSTRPRSLEPRDQPMIDRILASAETPLPA